MTVVAYALAVVLDLFILYIGARFLLRSYPSAAAYGVPATHDQAYLEVKGLRDLTFGLAGLALLFFAGPLAAAWLMLVAALVPLGDTLIVLRHGGTRAVAFGIHFVTAVVVLISAGLLFAV
jgi:hypothetical protein